MPEFDEPHQFAVLIVACQVGVEVIRILINNRASLISEVECGADGFDPLGVGAHREHAREG